MIHYYNRDANSDDGIISLTEQVMCWQNEDEIDGSEVTDARVAHSAEEVNCPRCLSILENEDQVFKSLLHEIFHSSQIWLETIERLGRGGYLSRDLINIRTEALIVTKKIEEREKDRLPDGQ
jgi:hypothetical protein